MKKQVRKEKGKFSKKTIQKVITMLKKQIAFYMKKPVNQLKLSVSKGNSKIGKVLNISLAPIVTCCNCVKCMYFCYDIKACLAYPSALLARARNTALFMLSRDEYFNQLHKVMASRKKNFYLRFHVSGEIVDYNHFERMINTALLFPYYRIWTYTKNYYVVNEWIRKHGGNKNC